MSTNFPNSLDSLQNPTSTDTMASVSHSSQHANANDAIEALQTKVGIDSSADTTSIDYKLTNASSSNPGHVHTASAISDFDTEVSNNTSVSANTTHRTSTGADHTYIDQDVTSGSSPTFNNTNISATTDKNYVTDAQATVIGNTSGTNSGDVTLAGTPDYITIAGQVITRNQIDLTADVTGVLPEANLPDASSTAQGVVELATTAEIDTGTDTTRAIPIDQFVASTRNVRYVDWRILAPTTSQEIATTVGGDFEFPFTGTIVSIGAYVDTAGTTGTATYDVNLNGTTIMTTNKISIETGEKSSRDATTPPALTTTAITAGDIITADVDAIQTGTAALGLVIRLGVRLS